MTSVHLDIRGEINRALAERIARQLGEACASDPVTVRIGSHGGDPVHAVRIARALRAHRGATTAVVTGQCDSAAVIALAACRSRWAGPQARFRMHATSAAIKPKLTRRPTAAALRDEAAALDRVDTEIRKFLAICTGCSVTELAALEEREATLSAREAIEVGLLTQVFGHPEWARERDRRRTEQQARAEARQALTPAEQARLQVLALPLAGVALGISPRALLRRLEGAS